MKILKEAFNHLFGQSIIGIMKDVVAMSFFGLLVLYVVSEGASLILDILKLFS